MRGKQRQPIDMSKMLYQSKTVYQLMCLKLLNLKETNSVYLLMFLNLLYARQAALSIYVSETAI